MQTTVKELKKIIKEELIRMSGTDNSITESQKQALSALVELTQEEASRVIALYESVASENT